MVLISRRFTFACRIFLIHFISLTLLASSLLVSAATPLPELQQQAGIEKRIDALLARMTLEEKLGQLQQLDGEANGKYPRTS